MLLKICLIVLLACVFVQGVPVDFLRSHWLDDTKERSNVRAIYRPRYRNQENTEDLDESSEPSNNMGMENWLGDMLAEVIRFKTRIIAHALRNILNERGQNSKREEKVHSDSSE